MPVVTLIGAALATMACVAVFDGGRWRLGLFVPPRIAALDFLRGGVFAVLLIGLIDALLVLTLNVRHTRGAGFPGRELLLTFTPAAVHEELVFRGYLYQKMRRWNRIAAIICTSIVFAAMHYGNRGLTSVAAANLVLAGVLLALAYERYERLWFPIGIHLVWNVLSGPILGYGVSGYVASLSVLRAIPAGPSWIAGGMFGIEGSVWTGVIEAGGIFLLARALKRAA